MADTTTDPIDILVYAVMSLVGVRTGEKTLAQHFGRIRKMWSEYQNYIKNPFIIQGALNRILENDPNELYLRTQRFVEKGGYRIDIAEDYSEHYAIALNHVVAALTRPKNELKALEARLAQADMRRQNQGYEIPVLQSMDEFLATHYTPESGRSVA